MKIYRCDRCKCLIEKYIPILFKGINQNEKIDKEEDVPRSLFSFWHDDADDEKYVCVTWQLCMGCTEGILHWLGHSENKLRKKVVKNGN